MHLMCFFNKYKLLHDSRSSLRQKHSCQTASVKLFDSLAAFIDRDDMIGALFLDFHKAFDLADHLIETFSMYKFSSSALQWINRVSIIASVP